MFTKGKYYLNQSHGLDPWVLAEFLAVQMKRLKDAPNRKKKILEMLDAASEYEGVSSQKVCSITPSRTQADFGQGANPSAYILPVSAVVPCLSFFVRCPLFGGASKLNLVCHQRTHEMLFQNVRVLKRRFH
ncbi:uncharacterized protein [Bemisia tabaci]|uniref:uncharacterized protein isoform X3 n=1 Tax=Bemisia tabaci TaxID=7038 RepID=UPI003B28539C